MIYQITIDEKKYQLELERSANGWDCRLDGRELAIDAVLARPDVLSILIDGKSYEIKRERTVTDTHLWVGGVRYAAAVRDPRSFRNRRSSLGEEHGPRKLTTPMPGKVVRILLRENDAVEAGQGILVIEAMKMQNEVQSPKKGRVQKIIVQQGTAVNAGDVLAIVE